MFMLILFPLRIIAQLQANCKHFVNYENGQGCYVLSYERTDMQTHNTDGENLIAFDIKSASIKIDGMALDEYIKRVIDKIEAERHQRIYQEIMHTIGDTGMMPADEFRQLYVSGCHQ